MTEEYVKKVQNNSPFFVDFLKTHMFSTFIQKHTIHPGLLFDLVEYICHNNNASPSNAMKMETIKLKIPADLDAAHAILHSKQTKSDKWNGYETDALLEKSNRENEKPKNRNLISRFNFKF
ncbi:hypothetical protein MHBO_000409 [Bonamia ostreae]|uniref:Uncharacterized protein n=1 Tax=Bonamia ostreae TaxID=126728 RepID=A0ABV2AFG2_9EUKA